MERTNIVAVLRGSTTSVNGRFKVVGQGYEFLSDSALQGGGPGEEIGTLELLVASLVVCALNVMRKDEPADSDEPSFEVEVYAHVRRGPGDGDHLGALALEFIAPDLSDVDVRARLRRYQERCRIYKAVRGSLDVSFFVNGREIDLDDARARVPQNLSHLPEWKIRRMFEC